MILACQLKNEKNNKLPSLSAISDYPSRRRKLKLYGFPEPLSHDLVARFSKRNSLINSFSEHLAFHYMAIFKSYPNTYTARYDKANKRFLKKIPRQFFSSRILTFIGNKTRFIVLLRKNRQKAFYIRIINSDKFLADIILSKCRKQPPISSCFSNMRSPRFKSSILENRPPEFVNLPENALFTIVFEITKTGRPIYIVLQA